jgi:hypothetical protein
VKQQTNSRVLQLTLKREYFAQIVQRTKNIEYRENKPYWKSRLEGKKYQKIHFRNGYSKNSPEMDVECRGIKLVGKGSAAEYQIRLGRISNLKRWR